jgi:uncharacterized protein (TIGR00369 family)
MTDPTGPSAAPAAPSGPGDAAQVAATLEAWLAREREIRLFARPPAPIGLDELARQGGLDFLSRIARGELPGVPIGQTLDFVPVEWESGRIVFQGSPRFEFYNPIGSVHGGYLATLLDSAMGCAVHSTLAQGIGYTTLELKLNYVRPLTDKTGPIRAEGKVISVSRRIGTAEGRAYDAAGRLYAHGTTTCLIFPLDPPSGSRPSDDGADRAASAPTRG